MTRVHFRIHYLIVIVVVLAGCRFDSFSILSFIRKTTNIHIPAHTKMISEFDNGEWVAGGKYLIKEKDIKAFLAENAFQPIDQHYRYISHYNDFSKKDHIPLSDPLHLKYISNCRGGNSWVFTVNENTGELWVEIQYPDWGGKGPCD